jgi:hypothetical protein
MPEFLTLKKAHDPDEVFQSDWYRHHRDLLALPQAGQPEWRDLPGARKRGAR